MKQISLILFTLLLLASHAAAQDAAKPQPTPLLTQALPDLSGKEVMMITLEFPPGAVATPHRHGAHTFLFVLEGSVVMGSEGKEPVTLNVGQTYYETPTDIHVVSKNASESEPAKVLVFFVKDEGAPPVTPVP